MSRHRRSRHHQRTGRRQEGAAARPRQLLVKNEGHCNFVTEHGRDRARLVTGSLIVPGKLVDSDRHRPISHQFDHLAVAGKFDPGSSIDAGPVVEEQCQLTLADVATGSHEVVFKTCYVDIVADHQGAGCVSEVLHPSSLFLDGSQRFVEFLFSLIGGQGEIKASLEDFRGVDGDDRFEGADGGLEDFDAVEQPHEDAFVDRDRVDEVDHDNRLLDLSDPVNAADSLLDLHRVPRQVVVDDRRTELEVQALAGDPVGKDEVVMAGTELGHDLAPLVAAHAAVQHGDAEVRAQPIAQIGQRRAGMGEQQSPLLAHVQLFENHT